MIQECSGLWPVIDPDAWVHESAWVMGDVVLARGASVWPLCVLRGDMGPIRIGADTNLQDGVICHDTTDLSETLVGDRVTVGHRAVLHGCIIEDDCLIGMGAIVMDNARIGAGSLVAAGSLVPPGKVIPPESLVMGSPGRVVAPIDDARREQIAFGWKSYAAKRDVFRTASGGVVR